MAWSLNGLGEAALAAGRPAEAIEQHTAADRIATELGARDLQARAHAGLGHARAGLGDLPAAREHYRRALEAGPDEKDAVLVRARLAEITAPDGRRSA